MSKSSARQRDDDIPTKFRVNATGSLVFKCKGAKILKATLEVNGVILSVLTFEQGDDWTPETETSLDFFGPGRALHRGLIPDQPVFVTLVHEGHRARTVYPSIMIGELSKAVTWDSLDAGEQNKGYFEDVTAGSAAGPMALRLAYFKTGEGGICGYVPNAK